MAEYELKVMAEKALGLIVAKILLIYHLPIRRMARTTEEHIFSFRSFSKFPVYHINTEYGFPSNLPANAFDIIIVHDTTMAFIPEKELPLLLPERAIEYIAKSRAYKIAFSQDEYDYCRQRFSILNHLGIDCFYTLVEPAFWDKTYREYTRIPKLIHTLPGYVSPRMVAKATRYAKPYHQRLIDIGFRGREWKGWGARALEKSLIARYFQEHASEYGLATDISIDQKDRIYGDGWYEFLGGCKGTIGAEGGTCQFKLPDGMVEGNVECMMITPRVFEAAASRCVQLLFEGRYSGILQPEWYLPIKKDYSNIAAQIMKFRDPVFARELTEVCYDKLIASGKYSYETFINGFDEELIKEGIKPGIKFNIVANTRITLALQQKRRAQMRRLFLAGAGRINRIRFIIASKSKSLSSNPVNYISIAMGYGNKAKQSARACWAKSLDCGSRIINMITGVKN